MSTPTSELVQRLRDALRIMRRWATLPEIPGWRADAVDPFDAALTDLAARLEAAERDEQVRESESQEPDWITRAKKSEARVAELERERDELLGLGAMQKAHEQFLRAEYAEARLAKYERVVEAARVVSEVERTGTLPDFQPLADALAALDDESGGA